MPISAPELSQAFTALVETASPSVVRVEGGRRHATSGFVVAPNRIVTVAHGLFGDEARVTIDGVTHTAKVKGRDFSTDLALLEVEATLTPLVLDDATPKVGQIVLQLARPSETVRATSGILSVVGQKPFTTPRGGTLDRYLETDAPHQPGFSGGPLLALDGKVAGLSTAWLIRGTPITISAATIKRVMGQLESHGQVRQSWLGLEMKPLRLPAPVQAVTGEEVGLMVLDVAKGGPAEAAGIRYGDTLLHLGDDSVRTLEDLYAYLRADHVGQEVTAKLYRQGAVEQLKVTLAARPTA